MDQMAYFQFWRRPTLFRDCQKSRGAYKVSLCQAENASFCGKGSRHGIHQLILSCHAARSRVGLVACRCATRRPLPIPSAGSLPMPTVSCQTQECIGLSFTHTRFRRAFFSDETLVDEHVKTVLRVLAHRPEVVMNRSFAAFGVCSKVLFLG